MELCGLLLALDLPQRGERRGTGTGKQAQWVFKGTASVCPIPHRTKLSVRGHAHTVFVALALSF